jgi:hypothetical protein
MIGSEFQAKGGCHEIDRGEAAQHGGGANVIHLRALQCTQ